MKKENCRVSGGFLKRHRRLLVGLAGAAALTVALGLAPIEGWAIDTDPPIVHEDTDLEEAKTAAIAEINAAIYLQDYEKPYYTGLVNGATTVDEINDVLHQIWSVATDLQKVQQVVISEINAADYLYDNEKTHFVDLVMTASTEEDAMDILTQVRSLAPATAVVVYRAYNPNDGDHLYTTNQGEFNTAVAAGWDNEGIAWHAASKGDPVYRLYNPNSGEHFYTTDATEYDDVAAAGWDKEGIAFYSDEDQAVPVYRTFNPNAVGPGSHHFTVDEGERDYLVSLGWDDEDIAFYGMAAN